MSRKYPWTIENADKMIAKWVYYKELIIRAQTISKEDSFEEKVVKYYIQKGNVLEVANIMNSLDYRVSSASGTRKVSSNDISAVIREKVIADEDLLLFARQILEGHTKYIDKKFN